MCVSWQQPGHLPGLEGSNWHSKVQRSHSTEATLEAPPSGLQPPPPPPPLPEDDKPSRRLPSHLQGKVVGHLFNAPWYALKNEVADFFAGCNLRPEGLSTVIDERGRQLCWRLVFDTEADLRAAHRLVRARMRIGGRAMVIDDAPYAELIQETNPRHPNRVAEGARGRTLLMTNLEGDVPLEALERFFEGFELAPAPFKLMRIEHYGVRTPLRRKVKGETRPLVDITELRVLVKFLSEREAHRALRERFGEFLADVPVELKVIF